MTQTPRGVTVSQFIKALRLDGFQATRTRGSRHVYRHSDGRRVVVAYHRLSATFPIGTLKGMIADAGSTDDNLRRLGLLN